MLKVDRYRCWEKPVLYEEVWSVALSEQEKYILDLIVLGVSELKIMWLTGLARANLGQIITRLEEKLGTDDLTGAGALLRDHEHLNPISLGARLAEVELRVLTGASVVMPIVAGEHCGLRLILADGTMMNAWIHAHEEIDHPGYVRLQSDNNDIQDFEQITRLLADVNEVMNGPPTTTRLARHFLSNLVERAIAMIDEIDGDSTLELQPDDESDSDQWLNPISLNPDYQREPIIISVAVTDSDFEDEADDQEADDQEADDQEADDQEPAREALQQPFLYQNCQVPDVLLVDHELEQVQKPVIGTGFSKAEYVIGGLPSGPRLPLARRMIADYNEFAKMWISNLSLYSKLRVSEFRRGQLEELRTRSEGTRHHRLVCEVISKAYFDILDQPTNAQ
jgi:hypothetical protein